ERIRRAMLRTMTMTRSSRDVETRFNRLVSAYYDFEEPLRMAIEQFLNSFEVSQADRELIEREIRIAFSRFNASLFDSVEAYIRFATRDDD
ncbi:MAG: hypothetical protein ONA90_01315, partial [candidate division KSB1 bacterium]|nr:hypothetical protein [candidate division KSB1 bacterium]